MSWWAVCGASCGTLCGDGFGRLLRGSLGRAASDRDGDVFPVPRLALDRSLESERRGIGLEPGEGAGSGDATDVEGAATLVIGSARPSRLVSAAVPPGAKQSALLLDGTKPAFKAKVHLGFRGRGAHGEEGRRGADLDLDAGGSQRDDVEHVGASVTIADASDRVGPAESPRGIGNGFGLVLGNRKRGRPGNLWLDAGAASRCEDRDQPTERGGPNRQSRATAKALQSERGSHRRGSGCRKPQAIPGVA